MSIPPEENGEPKILTDEEYIRLGEKNVDDCYKIMNMEGWRPQKTCTNGDIVEYLDHPEFGKVFRYTGQIDFDADILLIELFDKIEQVTEWCPSFIESKIIKKIDDHTDISYQVAAGGGGGVVSPRDFVNLRHLGFRGASMVTAAKSIEYPGAPDGNKHIRGYTRLGCWSITPVESGCISEFRWLMSMDMRGMLPRIIVDAAHTTVMLDYARHLRRHCANLKANKSF